MEEPNLEPERRPIYGALNISMQGHVGWGNSYFVLKPSIIKSVELRSRDSGDIEGIGTFAQRGRYDDLAPILKDWARIRFLEQLWNTLGADVREGFKPTHGLPLEAAITTEKGYIESDEIAMIVIGVNELKEPEKEMAAIQARCRALNIPLMFHDESAGSVPFAESPEYQSVIFDYWHYTTALRLNDA